ncbi:MAG: gliding motility lipoprotein GldJ, partial [Bacteroidota bacterium]
TLISDKSRVIKGGSWNDRAYWLSPGTRRFLEQEQSASTLGFRCAMDRVGSPEGNGHGTGINYKQRRQNSRKK